MTHRLIHKFDKRHINSGNVAFALRDAIAGGYVKDAFVVQKFGENADAGNSEEMLWSDSGAYTWMTTPQQVKIASVGANAGNDVAAGTGARTLEIQGLDRDYNLQSETVTLTGAAAVTSVNSYIRIFRAKVITVGGTGWNEGAINVYDNGGANQVAHIPITYNQTMQAEYTVPADYDAWLVRWYASSASNQTIDMFLRVRPYRSTGDSCFQVKHKIHIFRGFANETFEVPIQVTEKSDIYMSSIASAGSDIAGGFDLICIKET